MSVACSALFWSLLSVEAIGEEMMGGLQCVCKSSSDLQEIFACVASINPHQLATSFLSLSLSLSLSLVCFPPL